LIVIVVREPLTNVIRNAAGTQHGTGETPINRIFGRNYGDPFRAHFENLIVAVHLFSVVPVLLNGFLPPARTRDEICRNIFGNAPDADITHRQTASAARLEQIVDFLSRTEAIPEVGDGTHVDKIRAYAYKVVCNSAEL